MFNYNNMYKYFIRVDVHQGYDQGITMLQEFCQTCIGVYHTGKSQDNPHWHFAVECDAKTVPCLRARLRKFWSVSKSISIKNFDGNEKAIKYLFHEKDRDSFTVVSQKGYTDQQVNSFKEESFSKDRKVEKSKKRQPTFTERVVEAAVEKFGRGAGEVFITKEKLVRFVVDQFGGEKKVFDKFVIQRCYNVVAYHVLGHKFIESFVDEVCMMS